MKLGSGADIVFPLVATNSAVYDQIEDSEGGLICFMSMHEASAEICTFLVKAANAKWKALQSTQADTQGEG